MMLEIVYKNVSEIMIECSVSPCFFKITTFPISFSNAKWILISLESEIIEAFLNTKIYLNYFPGRLKYVKLGKSTRLTFSVPKPKVVEVIK